MSEFTHIVLEWVEEAFKELEAVTSSTKSAENPEMMDEGSNDQVWPESFLVLLSNNCFDRLTINCLFQEDSLLPNNVKSVIFSI